MTRRERLENKMAKRQEWAGKAAARSTARLDAAHRIADSIPLGQPILVGHHSEAHARRDADRIHSNMSKAIAESDLATHHEQAANGIAHALDRSIFSDDENAIEALRARIVEHEAQRDRMKLVNRLYKRGDATELKALGLSLDKLRAEVAHVGLSYVKAPYEGYQLTNLGARIRADQERIKAIEARTARVASAEATGVLIEGDEYVRVTFAEKPEREVLDTLKAAGFGWHHGSWIGKRAALPASVMDTPQRGTSTTAGPTSAPPARCPDCKGRGKAGGCPTCGEKAP